MPVILVPGFHSPELTRSFVRAIDFPSTPWIFPSPRQPPYSGHHVLQFGQSCQPKPMDSVIWIGFSAGAVGAIAAASLWQRQGGQTAAVILLDGWGVPLWGDFPMHRLSCDRITDGSSRMFGAGGDRFWADPPVGHLDLWGRPDQVYGRVSDVTGNGGWGVGDLVHFALQKRTLPSKTTAADFIMELLHRYHGDVSCDSSHP